jgi:hypothetical protein
MLNLLNLEVTGFLHVFLKKRGGHYAEIAIYGCAAKSRAIEHAYQASQPRRVFIRPQLFMPNMHKSEVLRKLWSTRV